MLSCFTLLTACTVQVPSLFQDNFDYGDIRRDFVYGILTSDLLIKNIHCYVAKDGYAARVADTRSYDAVRYVPLLRSDHLAIGPSPSSSRSYRASSIRDV